MFQNIGKKWEPLLLGWLLLMATVFLPAQSDAATLHAVIVADTTDTSIGGSTALDFENVRREMQKISFYTGLNLRETTFRGRDAVPENVLGKINQLEIKEEDVVIFYFSGHGYRTPSKGDVPWPNLYFSTTGTGIDYALIGEKLEARHPRFLMVIADACNNVVSDWFSPPLIKKSFMMMSPESNMERNYRKLFLEVKGVVMITSSKAGEYSWATERGGYFTLAFLYHLTNAVKFGSDVDWFTILDLASTQIERDQHPDFQIFLDVAG